MRVDHRGASLLDPRLKDPLMPRFTHAHDPLLSPPAHVLAEVDAAWERAQDLIAGELELHFERFLGRRPRSLRVPGGETVERLYRHRGAGARLR